MTREAFSVTPEIDVGVVFYKKNNTVIIHHCSCW